MSTTRKAGPEGEVLRCSFCNKDQNDVRKLIAGPTVFICDECVDVCNDIIADDRRAEGKTTRSGLPTPQEADLNMGLIDQAEAKRRRKNLEKEANFYGSMDGASKFVKGDAIAGIVILLINIVGGLAIGVTQRGMPWAEALQTYTLLTIGDGIVTQIPALVISVGTGIIITRSASDARLSDEIVRWATGTPGIASTRLLFVSDNRVWRVNRDGYGPVPVTAAGRTAYSPAWVPDGRRFVFTEYQEGKWIVVLQGAATNTRQVFPTTAATVNITPAVSHDGRRIAFSRIVDRTYAVHQANLADLCCVERLTPGRLAENLSPTYSPDGRRLAFVTLKSRSGKRSVDFASSPSMTCGWMYGSYPSVVSGAMSLGARVMMSAIARMELTIIPFAVPGWMFRPWTVIMAEFALNVSLLSSPGVSPSTV